MSEKPLLVLTTLSDTDDIEKFAKDLVASELAACVNVIPGIRSFYCWKSTIESAKEVQLLIKTTQALYPALQSWIEEQHPYEVPEILAIEVAEGLPAYLNWISTCTKDC